MSDSQIAALNNFTNKQHHNVPPYLDPSLIQLPANFTVCIIGASEGIGAQIAHAYAKASVTNLILAARTLSKLEKVRQSIITDAQAGSNKLPIGPVVEIVECDISSADSVASLADFVSKRFGRLDVLIPNAGYAGPVTLNMHLGESSWVQKAFDINAMGTYHAAHYFVPLLLSSPGGAKQFLAIGSGASALRRGHIANTGYCVSKFAQVRLVEFLHEQYGESDGLIACVIHPGAVKTGMAEGNTPETFLPYLIDDPGLGGAICVWLSKQKGEEVHWLSGRYISANWDMQELQSKKQEITEKDLLKFAMVVG